MLPDNNIRFGIRITNISELAIFDVEIILDFPESLFKLEGERLQKIGVIPSASARTAEFILKPLGCVHKINIEALITYRDAKSKKYRIDMHPKEVHCVCPFLKGKKMPRAEFLELSGSGHSAETGLNFKGVTVEQLTSFILQTCKIRHYKVDDFSINGGRMLYLASESIGEKAYYLLTALIKEEDDLTQVMLRAVSDKPHGLNGFLNETVADLRHVVETVQSAREIGVIKKGQVINIIDSVVQRTTFAGEEGGASVIIKDRVAQRAEFKGDQERKSREGERQSKEEQERLHGQKKEEAPAQREKEKQKAKQEEENIQIQKEEQTRRENERKAKEEQDRVKARQEKRVIKLGEEQAGKEKEKKEKEECSSSQKIPKTYANSIGMKFVLIPAGEFMMGKTDSYNIGNEKPVHRVKLIKPFYLGIYPVTQRQWKEVMRSNPSNFKGGNLPIENVFWNNVHDFIKKLNKKEGVNKYRLPSEAEWEYAVRAGTTSKFSFGDDESKLRDYAWYNVNSGGKTHDVGQKKPNPWGLYDMHGNVWEWVQDIYHDSYNGAPTDGSAWEGRGSDRVIRGSHWNNDVLKCRSATRRGAEPNSCLLIGFRLLKDL